MASDKEARRVVIDLANLQPVDTAMQGFREKYDLKGELAASEFPKELGKQHNLLNPDGRTLFLRDLAQRLWSGGGDERGVELLEEFLFAVNEGHVPVVSVRMGPVARAVPDRVRIDWRRQALAYQPQTKLQSAFYYLLRHSNLARVCANPECDHRYFIADRSNERYCSDSCFAWAKRETKKNWWAESGKQWRAARVTKKTEEK